MTFDPAIDEMLTSWIEVEDEQDRNVYGAPTGYEAAVRYNAHIEYKDRIVRGREGEDVHTTARAYVGVDLPLDTMDRITLPDLGKRVIVSAARHIDFETALFSHVTIDVE